MDDRLEDLRQRIDQLDEALVRLLNARSACALEIGALKRAMGLPVYQPDRELEVLRHVRASNPGPLDDAAITRLYERIIDEARRLERLAVAAPSERRMDSEAPKMAGEDTPASRPPHSGDG